MINNYQYKVTYRKRCDNGNKMQRVMMSDGTIHQVNGKPYYDPYVRELHFKTAEKAQASYERLKQVAHAGYVRMHEGSFDIEESYA